MGSNNTEDKEGSQQLGDGTSTTDNRQHLQQQQDNTEFKIDIGDNNNINNNTNNIIEDDNSTAEDRNSVSITEGNSNSASATNDTISEYEEIEGYRYAFIIDSDSSTDRTFKELVKKFDKEKDELYLFTATSSFDFLNEEKNNAKITLHKYQRYLDLSKIQYIAIPIEGVNLLSNIIQALDDNEIDIVYIGSKCLESTVNPDNLLYGVFSFIKKTLVGTIVYGLEKEIVDNSNNHIWKLNVIE